MTDEVEVMIAPGWVQMQGVALTDMKKGDPVFLEPSTGNVSNRVPGPMEAKVLKREDASEVYWKKRYDRLCTELQALHEQHNEFRTEVEERRVWELSDFIYVSYNYECCDTEEQAKKNWGDNYDIFRHWKSNDGETPK